MSRCCPPIITGGPPGPEGPPGPQGPEGPPGPAGEGACISTDAGNVLQEGTDGCLYVAEPAPAAPCVAPASEDVLAVDADGCLSLVTDPSGPIRPGENGLTVCLSADPDNAVSLDDDGCLYVPAPPFGQVPLGGPAFILNELAAGQWHDAPLTITLPEAGTYQIGGAVYGHLDKTPNTLGALLAAQLYDQTAGAVVPLSTRGVISFNESDGFTSTGIWHNRATAPMDVQYTVSGPTTLVLQGRYSGPVASPGGGLWSAAFLNNPGFFGSTFLNYRKIGA